jgi:hypothetical protein
MNRPTLCSNGLPQDDTAQIIDRPRGVPRRAESYSAWFGNDAREPYFTIRAPRTRSSSITTTLPPEASPAAHETLDETIGSEYSADTAHEAEVAEAIGAPKSRTASQVTILSHNPSGTPKVNTRPSSLRPSDTGTALDGLTGCPTYSAAPTKKPWIQSGAFSMQSLKNRRRQNQVGTDQQSQSGASVQDGVLVQSGKSKALALLGGLRRIVRIGKKRDTTVRETVAMDESITSEHEMYEGT